ncbi:MAG: DUF3794 domain-containing protein [Halanaerobiales bacterium]|nr:DUF3794 domain-containing protein [Halanaerobiales bacterium]
MSYKKDKNFKHTKKIQPLFSCEKFKLLKVIGEETVQVVSDTVDALERPAREIIEIDFELVDTTDHAFTDKVVKQGIICKRIIYCDTDGDVRCQFVRIPFTAVAEIPGVDPKFELEFQNKLILAETDYDLIDPNTLAEKVVFEIKIKVSKYVQRQLKVCNTNVLSHNQICR